MKKKDKDNTSVSTPELDLSIYPQEEYKNSKKKMVKRYILPDDFFEEHIKEIPIGSINESRTRVATKGGVLKLLGADPERDKEIQRAGAEALNAKNAQRKKMSEILIELLNKPVEGSEDSQQVQMCQAQIDRANLGDTKAFLAIRDTIGEKPAETIDLSADITTEADRALMEKLKARMIEEQ